MCNLAVFLVNSSICTTDFSDFTYLLQERVLLSLPGSATSTTDFSNFSLFCYGFCRLGWGQLFS